METIAFTIPGEPAGKGRPAFRKQFSRATGAEFIQSYSPKPTVNREAFIRSLANDAMAGRPPIEGPVQVAIRAVCAPARSMSKKDRGMALAGILWPCKRPDLDNIEKLILDAIKGVVWGDDVQVCRVVKEKRYGEVAQTMVTIAPITVSLAPAKQAIEAQAPLPLVEAAA